MPNDLPPASSDPEPALPKLDEARLWSWVDRADPRLGAYLEAHPEDRPTVERLRSAIGGVQAADALQGWADWPAELAGFAIEGVLGQGGMGVVLAARQAHPARRVALKVLPREWARDERWVARFRREADALARLDHPGIATVFATGTEPESGAPYIAMALVEGQTLDRYVKAERPSTRAAVLLAQRIAEAVGHAHDSGVVHRDLKPTNVMVTAEEHPVVLDFGLARFADDGETGLSHTGALLGTLPYMSPEQVRGQRELDARSDVYSLGVLIQELITGRRPYALEGLSLVEAAKRIETAPPRRPGRSVHRDLAAVLGKALAKEPARRYSSAGDLAADLRRYLEGRSVLAKPPALAESTLRFVRRHWVFCSFSVLTGLIGLLLLFPGALPIPLQGSWWRKAAVFEGLRWVGDQPEVLHAGEWYVLESIDGLQAGYVVGYCKQLEPHRWRKRFSEDLVQVLNRLGHPALIDVDLVVRDLEDRQLFTIEDVRWSQEKRRALMHDRNRWPWESEDMRAGALFVEFDGRAYELLELDGVRLDVLDGNVDYDNFCERVGRSPGAEIDLLLRDVQTDGIVRIVDLPRVERRD